MSFIFIDCIINIVYSIQISIYDMFGFKKLLWKLICQIVITGNICYHILAYNNNAVYWKHNYYLIHTHHTNHMCIRTCLRVAKRTVLETIWKSVPDTLITIFVTIMIQYGVNIINIVSIHRVPIQNTTNNLAITYRYN